MMPPNLLSAKARSLLLVGGFTFVSLHCNGDGGGVTPPEGPSIGLSETSLSFSGTQGAADPAAQTLAITNSGGGTLSGLATEVSYTAGQPEGWLSAELSATSAPSTLTLTAATGGFAPGTYTANVAVSSGVAANSPQEVSVTLTVAPATSPLIALSSTSQSFSAEQGGEEDPPTQAVAVANVGAATLDGLTAEVSYTAGEPTGWLSAELSGTTAPAALTLTASTGSLRVGDYTATVSIASPVAGNSPQPIAVTFAVTDPTEGLLYAVNASDDGLSTINPRTGVGRFIGRLGGTNTNLYMTPVAMAITPDHPLQRSILYVWNNSGDAADASASNGRLLTVSIGTGEGTPVNASTPPQGNLGAIAVSPAGGLYGSNEVANLYSVDVATGVRTLIAALGQEFPFGFGGMDFHCDGTLYAVEFSNGSERLVTIDPSTGAVTVIGTLTPNVDRIGSIAFSRAGTLIGSSLDRKLFDIDVTTAEVSNLRSISGAGVSSPQGMGFVKMCPRT